MNFDSHSHQNINSRQSKKTEKTLIALALLVLLVALGALYFDDWLWSGMRSRSNSIGMITSRSGDVRLKFDEDVSWQKAAQGQLLQYNDSVFAGQESEADLKIGESKLTVTQNSLVVLRREMDANFLNLNFGTLFGKVAKNEKIYIDTGSGKPTMLKTSSAAEIVLKKTGNKTSLEVVKGVAQVEVNGVTRSLQKNTKLELPSKPEEKVVEKVVDEKLDLQILPPSPRDLIYSTTPKELKFKWSYGNSRQVQPGERFEVQFSKDSSFSSSLRKYTEGSDELSMNVANSNQFFYRVKGPKGELSATHRFGFVRLLPPVVSDPIKGQKIKTKYGQTIDVPIRLKKDQRAQKTWVQIAGDPQFETVLVNESKDENEWTQSLPAGSYYMRAKSDYADNHLSDWSEPLDFQITEDMPKVQVPFAKLDKEVTIPNLAYPEHLYGASDTEAQQHLWEKGFLRDYFKDLRGSYDQLALDFGNGEVVTVKDSALPPQKIYPKSMRLKYQLQKAGQLPSKWSQEESLRIRLEPPKENFVELVESELKNDNQVPLNIEFTPVLFAKGYEMEVATNPSFMKSKKFNSKEPNQNVKLPLNSDHYWRVRALNAQGQPLSEYSQPRKLSSKEYLNQVRLAQQRRAPKKQIERKIAAEETIKSETRTQVKQSMQFYPDKKFWTWLGSGFSYVNYQQSISDRGTLDSRSQNNQPGQYFELGYVGESGYGGVIGYKSTPGDVIVDNADLDRSTYVWKTISLEGLMLKRAKFTVFGRPVDYGPRIGVQSHSIPYVFLNNADSLELKQNEMLTASAGLMADVSSGRWKFHTYMRYQLPITASSSGAQSFELRPKFAFDGLLGSTYYLSNNFKVGAFWYGQWHNYDFVYSSTDITNSGSQSLFYSTMDLRLGFEF